MSKKTSSSAIPKLAYNTNEAAEMLGVNPATVWRLTKRGLLRPSKGIRYARYTLEELQRYLRETASQPTKA
jgi:DNA-binding transcriptional MerR regulator